MPIGRTPSGYYLILTEQAGREQLAHHRCELHSAVCIAAGRRLRPAKRSNSSIGHTRMVRSMAAELDYVPLPASLTAQVESTWKAQIKSNGAPVWKGQ